jgi:hypothetical protein
VPSSRRPRLPQPCRTAILSRQSHGCVVAHRALGMGVDLRDWRAEFKGWMTEFGPARSSDPCCCVRLPPPECRCETGENDMMLASRSANYTASPEMDAFMQRITASGSEPGTGLRHHGPYGPRGGSLRCSRNPRKNADEAGRHRQITAPSPTSQTTTSQMVAIPDCGDVASPERISVAIPNRTLPTA